MAERAVTVHVTVGEPRMGLWCDRCALPSKVEFPLYSITARGVSLLRAVPFCTEHGRDEG